MFKDDVIEGKLYTINHYEVGKHDHYHCVVRNELIIKFTPHTTVIEELETIAEIPMHKFEVLPLHRLDERNNKKD